MNKNVACENVNTNTNINEYKEALRDMYSNVEDIKVLEYLYILTKKKLESVNIKPLHNAI